MWAEPQKVLHIVVLLWGVVEMYEILFLLLSFLGICFMVFCHIFHMGFRQWGVFAHIYMFPSEMLTEFGKQQITSQHRSCWKLLGSVFWGQEKSSVVHCQFCKVLRWLIWHVCILWESDVRVVSYNSDPLGMFRLFLFLQKFLQDFSQSVLTLLYSVVNIRFSFMGQFSDSETVEGIRPWRWPPTWSVVWFSWWDHISREYLSSHFFDIS